MSEGIKSKTLPSNWVSVRISDVCKTTSGGTPSRKKSEYYGGDIPWLKSGELNDGVVHDVEEFITSIGLKNSSAKLFPAGTLLIALYGATVGRLGILGLDAATNQAVCAIFNSPAVDQKYLFWYLVNIRKDLLNARKGGAQPNISQKVVRDIELPLAPLNEQRRIVAKIEELFSDLDAGVAQLKQVQQQLKRYRQSVLKAAVEGKLTAAWRVQHGHEVEPAEQLLARILKERRAKWEVEQLAKYVAKGKKPPKGWQDKYKEPELPDISDLPELPAGWAWGSLDQLSDSSSISYGVIKLGDHISDGVPTLRSSNVRHLKLELDNVKSISRSLSNSYGRTILKGGEVLITIRGTLGGVVAIPDECIGSNVSREVAVISPLSGIGPEYLAIALGSKKIMGWLLQRARGIAYTGINLATLKKTPVPVPPENEQQLIIEEVGRLLSIHSDCKEGLRVQVLRANMLRNSILSKAFQGKLVLSNTEDEPASMLIERIRLGNHHTKVSPEQS